MGERRGGTTWKSLLSFPKPRLSEIFAVAGHQYGQAPRDFRRRWLAGKVWVREDAEGLLTLVDSETGRQLPKAAVSGKSTASTDETAEGLTGERELVIRLRDQHP